jgi:hypothetical protein
VLAIRYRWKGKCPKHVRYNPAKHGEEAIKGACPHCRMLFQVFKAHRATIGQATIFDEVEKAGQAIFAIRGAAARVCGEKAS